MKTAALLLLLLGLNFKSNAQGQPGEDSAKYYRHTTGIWLGFYTKYKLKDRLYYYGEYHLRRKNWFDEMAQIYLRFGLSYLIDRNIELTAGVVTPLYWSGRKYIGDPDYHRMTPQFRGWQQAIFFTPFERMKLYHQLRSEQRWARPYLKGNPFRFTQRFRYKISVYYPINHSHLTAKTLFLSYYEEIFMQFGKSITYNTLEDNRMFLGLGYVFDSHWQAQFGYMNTFRYDGAPNKFELRHVIRLSIYHALDLGRK